MSPPAEQKIWWLASYPKSGNTWLRMFLSAYRNGGRVDINRPHGLLVDDIQPYFHQIVSPLPLSGMPDGLQVMLRPAALLSLSAAVSSHIPLLVKTHSCNGEINDIPLIPARLTHGAVYLVRDPRDVVVSLAEHNNESVDDAIIGMGRDDRMLRRPPTFHVLSSWSNHVKSWTRGVKFPCLVTRYEDMLARPRDVFRDILVFLRHDIDDDLLERSAEAASFERLRAQEQAVGFRERAGECFFSRGRSGNWPNVLTDEQVAQIESDHGEVMRAFGYIPTGEV